MTVRTVRSDIGNQFLRPGRGGKLPAAVREIFPVNRLLAGRENKDKLNALRFEVVGSRLDMRGYGLKHRLGIAVDSEAVGQGGTGSIEVPAVLSLQDFCGIRVVKQIQVQPGIQGEKTVSESGVIIDVAVHLAGIALQCLEAQMRKVCQRPVFIRSCIRLVLHKWIEQVRGQKAQPEPGNHNYFLIHKVKLLKSELKIDKCGVGTADNDHG